MKNENKANKSTSEKTTKRSRWHRNADGTYRYAGVCPFNNAVCRLRNTFVRRKNDSQEG